ncbi:MAG: TolC family protein [Kiritimatiellae bacterium]|nr:TolC family protein [Kiritimatiellia bacterium]
MNKNLLLILHSIVLCFTAGCVSFDPLDERQNQTSEFLKDLQEKQASILAKPLSLEICIATAMTNNYEVRLAALDTELGQIARSVSFSAFLPQVTAAVGYSAYSKDPVTMSDKYERGSINVSLPIIAPSSWYLFDAVKHSQEAAALAESYVRQAITLDTTTRYFEVLIQEQLVTAIEAQVAAAEAENSRVQGLFNEGFARDWERSQAAALLTDRLHALEQANNNLRVAKAKLLEAMGLNPLVEISIEKTVAPSIKPEGTIEDLVLKTLEQHPELAIADRQVVIKENEVRQAFCEFIPVVSLFTSFSFTGNEVGNPPSSNLSYGFDAAWTVFKGFYNVANYKRSKLERTRSEYEREKTFLSIITRVVAAEAAVREAHNASELAKAQLAVAKAKAQDYAARAGEGLIKYSDALDAKAALDAAEVVNVRAGFAEQIAIENLRYVMGEQNTNVNK